MHIANSLRGHIEFTPKLSQINLFLFISVTTVLVQFLIDSAQTRVLILQDSPCSNTSSTLTAVRVIHQNGPSKALWWLEGLNCIRNIGGYWKHQRNYESKYGKKVVTLLKLYKDNLRFLSCLRILNTQRRVWVNKMVGKWGKGDIWEVSILSV